MRKNSIGRRRNLAVLIFILPFATVFAAAPAAVIDIKSAEDIKTVHVERTSVPPRIDGVLDEPLWAEAAKVDRFYQLKPTVGALPTERTEIRITYDDDAIYIAAKMWDEASPNGIAATNMKHNSGLRDDDRISVVFDPFNTHRVGYRFETNANGVRNDVLVNGTLYNFDWMTIWDVAAKAYDGYWCAEFAIPFKSLPLSADNGTWGLNFGRAIRRKGEESAWVSHNRNWGVTVPGTMTGLSGMRQGAGLDIVPGLTLTSGSDRLAGERTSKASPSLDAYYRVTPSLNASITFNTDFSATEVDDRQVNLSRFGLFFPEKRDFFLNDSELFDFGQITSGNGSSTNNTAISRAGVENGRPFFSRRLGLSSSGTPVDIQYGAKLSGRVGRWNIGTLAIQQDNFTPTGGATINSPLALVARVSANVLSESTFGGIYTSGNNSSNDSNSLVGLDFNFRNSHLHGNKTLEASLWAQKSHTSGLSGRDGAAGVGISYPNESGWRGAVNIRELQQNFNPALGYVNVRGVRQSAGDIGYTGYLDRGWVHSWYSGVDYYQLNDIVRDTSLSRLVKLRLVELSNAIDDSVSLVYSRDAENVLKPFTLYTDARYPVAVPAGRYRFSETALEITAGRSRSMTGSLKLSDGSFYDGWHHGITAQYNWKQSRYFILGVSGIFDRIELSTGRFTNRLLRVTTDVAFTPNAGVTSSVQYDNNSELIGIQSRLYWVPRAGQRFSLVLNHAMQDPDRDRRFDPTTTELSARASYTFRY